MGSASVKPLLIRYWCKPNDLEGIANFLAGTAKFLKKMNSEVTVVKITYQNCEMQGWINEVYVWYRIKRKKVERDIDSGKEGEG